MPSKKKKFNARFPPARIKKIMQTDEDVGKVAAPVPVIISRALELFLESLILKTNETTQSRNARTLTCSHIKQTILVENKFDFLKDLVANVPDVQEEEESHPPKEPGQASTSGTGKPRGRPRKPRPEGAPPLGRPRKRKTPTSSTDESCDNNETRTDEEDTDEASEDTEQDEPAPLNPWPIAVVEMEQPQVLEVGEHIPRISPKPEQNSNEEVAAKFEPSALANKILAKQGLIKQEDGVITQIPVPSVSNSPLGHEQFIKKEDSIGRQPSPVASVGGLSTSPMPFKQELEEHGLGKEVTPEVQQLPATVPVTTPSVVPKVEVAKPSVQKKETAAQNFPHHIENLIRPDAPKKDIVQMSYAHGMNDMHLPKDHDNNIAGKCMPPFPGMQPVDLSVKKQGFPVHLPSQMLLPGHQPPCLPLPQMKDVSPLVMAQRMQLPVPPPMSVVPKTQTLQEDDDYDS